MVVENGVMIENIEIPKKIYDTTSFAGLQVGSATSTGSLSPTEAPMRTMHRLVLTGGPCAGKTTGINHLRTFFESIGWKVLCVPETATLLFNSGFGFMELDEDQRIQFQEDLLKTLLRIEDTINETARYFNEKHNLKTLVIYDRGAMDPIAYMNSEDWNTIKGRNQDWNEVGLRDNRYDQIIHLVTAANGAEEYYTLANNSARSEGIELAREIDDKLVQSWVGHPSIDVIDNSTEFNQKLARCIQSVCNRIGLRIKGISNDTQKRKFICKVLADSSMFPTFQDFQVVHNYLLSTTQNSQVRIRKRGQGDNWVYTYTVRTHTEDGRKLETRRQVTKREYTMLLSSVDETHYIVYKLRRCFVWKRRAFHLDIYQEPCNASCNGLILLETYCDKDDKLCLPDFLEIDREVTDDSKYSMYNLSLK